MSSGFYTLSAQELTVTSTTQLMPLGSRVAGSNGAQYIYLQGVAATAVGNFVKWDENYQTELLAANAVGPVGIAMSANVANRFGWYQIYGINTQARTDTIAADKACYIDGTAGRVDDAVVAGDLVVGCYSMTADTNNVATVSISYPSVTDVLG